MSECILVPVDRATVRKNPMAGNTISYIAGRPSVTEVRIVRLFEPSPPVNMQSWSREVWEGRTTVVEDGIPRCADGALTQRETVEYGSGLPPPDVYLGEHWRPSLQVRQPLQELHHGPAPAFLFSHVTVPVACNHCGATFPHTELEADSIGDDDDYAYSDQVCPRCHAWGCCPPLKLESPDRDELAALAQKNAALPAAAQEIAT